MADLIPPSGFTVRIRPPGRWPGLRLKEIWQYRELLYILTWRDVKVRYKQTVIGAVWAILQPFLVMVVFSVIFGMFIKIPSNGLPYPIFTYTGLLPWIFFSTAISRSGGSLIYDSNLISKVYFPRLIVPIAAILGMLVDFFIAFFLLLAMMVFYGIFPGLAVLTVPFLILLTFLAALGVGLWLSALNVKYRDVGYVIQFLTQFWFFITPVAYPSSSIPETWRWLYGLNPMVGVLEGFRWALLGNVSPPVGLLGISAVVTLVLLASGLYYFTRVEYEFADVV